MSMIQALLAAKDQLKPAPFTVVTQKDGSRYLEKSNGTLSPLSDMPVDEDGKWGILDEKGALGLDPKDKEAGSGESDGVGDTYEEEKASFAPSKEMQAFASAHPEVAPFLKLVQMGAPLGSVQTRVTMAALSGKLDEAVGARFVSLAMGDGLGQGAGGCNPKHGGKQLHVGDALRGHASELHGHLGDASWEPPRVAVVCAATARPGYNSAQGHEYLDTPQVLKAKVKTLAAMLTKATCTVAYAGAGLSTSSGVNDYATKTGAAGVAAKAAAAAAATAAAANQATDQGVVRACAWCGAKGKLLRCASCKAKWFCNNEKKCLREAWTKGGHKAECKATQAAASTSAAPPPKAICGGKVSPLCARPNVGHRVLAAMGHAGLLHRFVQQNHDGLPQKAGMPQNLINEIHGAWFDPSNPVVAMSGSLREDLFADLLECERQADLVLAVGSSLCGMNSDRLVSSAANRARANRNARRTTSTTNVKKVVAAKATLSCCCPSAAVTQVPEWPGSPRVTEAAAAEDASAAAAAALAAAEAAEAATAAGIETRLAGLTAFGSVIVGLQQTVHDSNSSLRIFALLDDVFTLLAAELGLDLASTAGAAATSTAEDVRLVPYDRVTGLRLPAGAAVEAEGFMLDLREGSALVVAAGPDSGSAAIVVGKNADGHWRVSVARTMKSGRGFSETRLLGGWWLDAAARGEVGQLPLVPARAPSARPLSGR